MRRKLTIDEVAKAFVLANSALGVFAEYGMASYDGQVDMVRYCAKYILTGDKDAFIYDTEFLFGFDEERIDAVLKDYKKDLKMLHI